MTRKVKSSAGKKRAGVLMGMRSGVKTVANKVVGDDGKTSLEAPKPWVRLAGKALNVVLIIVVAVVLLRRCGVIRF